MQKGKATGDRHNRNQRSGSPSPSRSIDLTLSQSPERRPTAETATRRQPSHHNLPPANAHDYTPLRQENWAEFLRASAGDSGIESSAESAESDEGASRLRQNTHRILSSGLDQPNSAAPSVQGRKRMASVTHSSDRKRSYGGQVGDLVPNPFQGTASDPVDLTSPRPPRLSQPSVRPQSRSGSVILPTWQPDAEVDKCPACGVHFSFLTRKHHCRKCGKVVCNSCSTHRITIPRRFIVKPPGPISSSRLSLGGLVDTMDGSPFQNMPSDLGGGEEVRVCNPCVPDPNYSLPPQPSPSSFPALSSTQHVEPPDQRNASRIFGQPQQSQLQQAPSRMPLTTFQGPMRVSSAVPSNAPEGYRPTSNSRLSNAPSQAYHHRLTMSSSNIPAVPPHPFVGPPVLPSSHSRRSTVSSSQRPLPHPSLRPLPALYQPQPPRRQIAEEDECPVCGCELPARGPSNDDAARIRHVQDCIGTHSSSFTSRPVTSRLAAAESVTNSAPSESGVFTAMRSRAGFAAHPSSQTGPSGPSVPPQRRPARMLEYLATEKDCIGEDGGPQECVICFEEFEVGDEMGRLECLCRFHKKCIVAWWRTKGVGSCPTHQLHD